MKLKNLAIVIPALGIFFCANTNAFALPGDTTEVAIERFHTKTLSRNAQFRSKNDDKNKISQYESKVNYRNQILNISVFLPSKLLLGITASPNPNQDIVESVKIENSSIALKLAWREYNPRQDQIILNIVQGLWGETVAQDFLNSRFQSGFQGDNGLTENVYIGNQFIYEITRFNGPHLITTIGYRQQPHFEFAIYSLRDGKKLGFKPK
jgi:hypothetical protein